ncbi:MAG: type II toxin-antitoxin system RelE/ParE family toxin [Cyanobacteria bacterium J06576_12]
MPYKVLIAKPVQKQINKLPLDIQLRIDAKVQALATDPRPEGVRKLKGYDSEYRIRVSSYRVRYEIDDDENTVRILQCRHRKDIYRDRD